jgi:hypothetical protein
VRYSRNYNQRNYPHANTEFVAIHIVHSQITGVLLSAMNSTPGEFGSTERRNRRVIQEPAPRFLGESPHFSLGGFAPQRLLYHRFSVPTRRILFGIALGFDIAAGFPMHDLDCDRDSDFNADLKQVWLHCEI